MPVPRFGSARQERPSGMVPPPVPLDGVIELRLHGVGGATPQSLLADLAPQQVSGDQIAGFYRTLDSGGRHVEAYSWGGLTSRSGWRVLWMLLLPFALANLAGWMCQVATFRSPFRFRLHRAVVRWCGLGMTVNLLLILAVAGMDLVGYQCGRLASCAGGSWLLQPLAGLADQPGRRVLLGALLPLLAVVALAVLTLRSIRRYEETTPLLDDERRAARGRRSAAQPGMGLTDPGFWDGRHGARDLGYLHLAAGLGFLALVLAHTVRATARATGTAVAVPGLWLVALVLAAGVLAAVLVLVTLDACRRRVAAAVLVIAGVAVLCAGWFATAQPAAAGPQPHGYLPGMRDLAGVTFAAVLAGLLLVLLSAGSGGWRPSGFRFLGPFVVLGLGVTILNLVAVGAVLNTVSLLISEVSPRTSIPDTDTGHVFVYPIVEWMLEYLTVLPLLIVLLFGLYLVASWRRAGAGPELAGIRDWYRRHSPVPDGDQRWLADATEGGGGDRWLARVARMRRLARMPRQLDLLFTVLAVAGVGLLAARLVTGLGRFDVQWLTFTVGSTLAAGLPVLVLLLIRRGWRDVDSRRRIGMIWDVCTFWPRSYHPLAPPSYAERAVPELQRRLARLQDGGGRVVLAAHSQGSVLAVAALVQPGGPPGRVAQPDRIALVTFGSPLGTLYGWGFPAYFHDDLLGELAGTGLAWRNFYYQTDYIGGAAFTSRSGAGVAVDAELPDPATRWYVRDQSRPATGSHSGYWTDPAVWREVDRLAEGRSG